MSTPRSLTLTLFLLIVSHVSLAASIPPRQFGDDGSFNDIIASITSDLAFDSGPVTTMLGSGAIPTEVAGSEDGAPQDGTYVTKVSLVGGDEITLGPTGQSGVETVLGSLTFTVAGPPLASESSPPASATSDASQPSGSASGSSAVSTSGSMASGTSSATTTASGSSASITSSNSKSSTTSASKSSSSSTSTNAKSSSTSSSSASASASDSSSASPSHSIDVRFFTTGIATVLGGVLLGAWIV